jgi:F-type H+-transporting ATPase subunit b
MFSRLIKPSSIAQLSVNSGFQNLQLSPGVFGAVYVRPISCTNSKLAPYKEHPDRDLVNFPRPKRLLTAPPTKFGLIPAEWFEAFYPRTGVTGPYVFGVGLLAYLFSKEIWVLEHEFWGGVSFFAMIIFAQKKFGPQLGAYLNKEVENEISNMYAGQKADIQANTDAIEAEKKAQWQAEGQTMLFEVKRENVALQAEAAFRQRQMEVYSEVKKRLDYQVDKQQVERNIQQKHMVNWIISRVQQAITPESEKENLKKCIQDLKGLATKA